MPRKKIISDEIREQVANIVGQFNEENALPVENNPVFRIFRRRQAKDGAEQRPGAYVPRFRGAYLYLDRVDFRGQPTKICRLKWTGAMHEWEFAIYKHSSNRYDPDEWMFPGSGLVDGTVPGAMKAGNKAYPV